MFPYCLLHAHGVPLSASAAISSVPVRQISQCSLAPDLLSHVGFQVGLKSSRTLVDWALEAAKVIEQESLPYFRICKKAAIWNRSGVGDVGLCKICVDGECSESLHFFVIGEW